MCQCQPLRAIKVHFCPGQEEGDSVELMEENRINMEREMLKTIPDCDMVDELMVSKFAQRKREMVGDEPLLSEIRNRTSRKTGDVTVTVKKLSFVCLPCINCFVLF